MEAAESCSAAALGRIHKTVPTAIRNQQPKAGRHRPLLVLGLPTTAFPGAEATLIGSGCEEN